MNLTKNENFYVLEIPTDCVERVEKVETKGRLVYVHLRDVFGLNSRVIKLILKNLVTLRVVQIEDNYKDKLIVKFN